MSDDYRFLPFRFKRFQDKFLLANDTGDYLFLTPDLFKKFSKKSIDKSKSEFFDLLSKNMICEKRYLAEQIDILATKYRTKKQFLYEFTSLHMLVITQRCNQKCSYCHASSEEEKHVSDFDMDISTAKRCVDVILMSPSQYIKIEFQGGEPLLNFQTIKETVLYAKKKDPTKIIDFVICTNLTLLSHEHLDFIKKHDIYLSISLDGPESIHDSCRKCGNGQGTYQKVIEKLMLGKAYLGEDKISALMTVTPYSLNKLKIVVDEYIKQGLPSLFIRMLNPYGAAISNWKNLAYTTEEFIGSYRDALNYIIDVNLSGIFFPEELTTIFLTKILTPFSTGFVDLQSPSGTGIGGVIYEVNGDVYVADEGRMLAKMTGDKIFCIGNVFLDPWYSMFGGKKLQNIVNSSCIESQPGCAWCVYQPFCGSDPVRNYIEFGTFTGNPIKSEFCKKYKAILDIIFGYLLENDGEVMDVFWSWVTNRDLSAVQIQTEFNKTR